jgi:preprotein translocase subunit SecY
MPCCAWRPPKENVQLLTVAVPYFQKLQKEGESGRKKINQYTRVLTIGICLAQSAAYIASNIPAEYIYPEFQGTLFNVSSMIILTAGTVFCMWMGEKITDRGIEIYPAATATAVKTDNFLSNGVNAGE